MLPEIPEVSLAWAALTDEDVNNIAKGLKTQHRFPVEPEPLRADHPWPTTSSEQTWHDVQRMPMYYAGVGMCPYARFPGQVILLPHAIDQRIGESAVVDRVGVRVLAIEVERLQLITPASAQAECPRKKLRMPNWGRTEALETFPEYWNAHHPLFNWDYDPMVWVIVFEAMRLIKTKLTETRYDHRL